MGTAAFRRAQARLLQAHSRDTAIELPADAIATFIDRVLEGMADVTYAQRRAESESGAVRVPCPACGREVALSPARRVWTHMGKTGMSRCLASGMHVDAAAGLLSDGSAHE